MNSLKECVLTSQQLHLFRLFLAVRFEHDFSQCHLSPYQLFVRYRSDIFSVIDKTSDGLPSISAICKIFQDYEKSLNCGSELMAIDSNQDNTIEKIPIKKQGASKKVPQ